MDFKIKKENKVSSTVTIPTLLFSTDVPIAKISYYLNWEKCTNKT